VDAFKQASILIVDDDAANMLAMKEILTTLGSRLVTATSGEQALRHVLDEDFAAILLDVRMPGIDGFTTAKLIRDRKRSRHTPIIFMTAAQEDLASMFRGYRAGGVDYIVKPIIPEVLRSKLSVFIGLHDMNRMLSAELAERALSEQRLRTSEEKLRALALHLQSVREEERIRIAREVHDDLGQALTGLKFDIALFTRNYENEPAQARAEKAAALNATIDRLINAVRRISSGLRPEVLDEIGLAAALEWQAREFQKRTGTRIQLNIAPEFREPDKERATALFRIFQELVTNVARHANATRVTATLDSSPSALTLVVSDNGRGIRDEEIESRRSLGFLGLRERVLAFGGTVEATGQEGKGTCVAVTVPVAVQQPVFHA
jgi:signal transduction histidine kinase